MTAMTRERRIMSPQLPDPVPGPSTLEIETFSYEERRVIFPAINEALEHCGCWLMDRRPVSFTAVEFRFELQLRSIVDLYAALIAAGLELTRASHDDLTILCTLRQHESHPTSLPGVVTVGLRVNFLEDANLPSGVSIGPTHA